MINWKSFSPYSFLPVTLFYYKTLERFGRGGLWIRMGRWQVEAKQANIESSLISGLPSNLVKPALRSTKLTIYVSVLPQSLPMCVSVPNLIFCPQNLKIELISSLFTEICNTVQHLIINNTNSSYSIFVF